MFVLYRIDHYNAKMEKLVFTPSWEDMVRFIEDFLRGRTVTVVSEYPDIDKDFWMKDAEIVFQDDEDNVYAVYAQRDSTGYLEYLQAARRNKYKSNYYDEDYDDGEVDYWGKREYAHQRQQQEEERRRLERQGKIFSDPDLLMQYYFPKGQAITKASRKNDWFVGALV